MSLNWDDKTALEQIIQEELAATKQIKEFVDNNVQKLNNSKCYQIKKLSVDLEPIIADNAERRKQWNELTSQNIAVYNELKTTFEKKTNELIKLKSQLRNIQNEKYNQTKLLAEKKSQFEETEAVYKQAQEKYIEYLDMFVTEKDKSPESCSVIVTFKSYENFPVKFSIKARKIVAFDAGKLKIDPQTKTQLKEDLRKGNAVKVLCNLRKIIMKV